MVRPQLQVVSHPVEGDTIVHQVRIVQRTFALFDREIMREKMRNFEGQEIARFAQLMRYGQLIVLDVAGVP